MSEPKPAPCEWEWRWSKMKGWHWQRVIPVTGDIQRTIPLPPGKRKHGTDGI